MQSDPVLDASALARLRKLGGEKLLSEMIALFLQHAPARLAAARAGNSGGDARAVERAAHSLTSTAANLGAVRVQRLARRVEELAGGGDLASAAQLLPDLEEELARAAALLRAERPEPAP